MIAESISRFARNTRDLLDLVERLTEKGVESVSKKEAIDIRKTIDANIHDTKSGI